MNNTILTIARGGMEITWRYAWALYLTQLAIHRQFPLPAAVCAFLMAAVITQSLAGRNWRVYQRLLLQITGFIPFALLVVHAIQYQSLPFFSLDWIGRLFLEVKSISQWFILILTLFCLYFIWRGGQILVKSSRLYFPVCTHFDKGLGFFFLLLIFKAFIESKIGFYLQDRDIVFPAIAYLVFSMISISIARNQSKVQKTFLAGHRGMGVILTISTLVTLLGTGLILLIYPYLHVVADSLLNVTKVAAQSMDPVIFKTLLFLLRRKERTIQSDDSLTGTSKLTNIDTPKLTDVDTQTLEGGGSLFQMIVGWGLFGIIGMVVLATLVWLLIYILGLLLKRSREDMVQPLSMVWILDLLCKLAALPRLMWHGWVSLLKGVDCAAMVYVGMLRWGRLSGMDLISSETPAEYGKRLMDSFPGLGTEIKLIVEAFNKEVYGQTTTDREILYRLRSAQRRMKSLRYWPARIKVWFFQ